MLRLQVLAAAFLIGWMAAGCSSRYEVKGTVKVSGKVTNAGVPLEVQGREMGLGMVAVGFCPLGDGKAMAVETASASVDSEGQFEVIDGIEPGKYLVTIRQWDPYPQVDKLNGKFDERNSRVIREITEDTEIVLDVSQPDG